MSQKEKEELIQKLKNLRSKIQQEDEKLLKALKDRFELALEVGHLKTQLGLSLRNLTIEKRVFEHVEKLSKDLNLDLDFVRSLVSQIIDESIRLQKQQEFKKEAIKSPEN